MKKQDVIKDGGLYIDALILATVRKLLGSEKLYQSAPEDLTYDAMFIEEAKSNNNAYIPLIIIKALYIKMRNMKTDYEGLVQAMVNAFTYNLEVYDFEKHGEILEEDDASHILRLTYGNYNDLSLDRLIKAGVSGLQRWRMLPGDFRSQHDASIPYNFFTSVYQKLFNVPSNLRQHLLYTIPSINYPSIMLESYIYLKSLRMPDMHFEKTCNQAILKYNNSLEIDKDYDFILQTYPITQDINIDDILDRKAKIHEPYEVMLLLFLCFSASCKNDEIVWDALSYYELYALTKNIIEYTRPDESIIAGRVISENFYKDMRKAVFIKIQSTATKTSKVEITSSVFTGADIIKPSNEEIFTAVNTEIINFMASGLPSDMWVSSSELPASWIALL